MSLADKHLYEFGKFRLDTQEKVLLCDETPIELTAKAFELLTLFVENHGRLLNKDKIMEKIWADSFVEESNLTFYIGQLRKILGDDAQRPMFIKTVRQHGYRFIAPVRELSETTEWSNPAEENRPVKTLKEDLSAETVQDASETRTGSGKSTAFRPFSKLHPAIVVFVILVISTLVAVLIINGSFEKSRSGVPILSRTFKSTKLTNTGGVFQAVISPDGRLMAYSSESGGKYGVWIRRMETAENTQLIANTDDLYGGLGFSHDSQTLYFSRVNNEIQTIYRISTLGGIPKEVVTQTQGWFSLSPDDRQISFIRCPYNDDEYCALYTANTDGSNERRLLSRPRPIMMTDNQFSPDGKSIALAVGHSRSGSQEFGLMEIDVKTGAEREITKQKFFHIKYLAWLPDKSGLLFTANDYFYNPMKINLVLNSTGEVQSLTNDSINYNRLSFDNTYQKLITTQITDDFKLWLGPAEDFNAAKSITSATGACTFTPSGKLVYGSYNDGANNIWSIDSDGTNQRQLTSNQGANINPRVSPDERFIYFESNRTGVAQIWRMNMDGSNQTQVTDGEGGSPFAVSPDGNTVYFATSIYRNLSKVTIDGGGKFVSSLISKERLGSPELSPSGATIAYISRIPEDNLKIILMSVSNGSILKTFEMGKVRSYELNWAKDEKSIFYVVENNAKRSIWRLWLENGKYDKISDLTGEDEISDFTFSADGKSVAYVRGKWRHDALLIEGLK